MSIYLCSIVSEENDSFLKEVRASSPEEAATKFVAQWECDTAEEYGIAKGQSVAVKVISAELRYKGGKLARVSIASIYNVTGEYVPAYYAHLASSEEVGA